MSGTFGDTDSQEAWWWDLVSSRRVGVWPCGDTPASLTPQVLPGPKAIRGNRKRLKRRMRGLGRLHDPTHQATVPMTAENVLEG